jgi:ATP-binding cassette subfamily B protein
MVKNFRNQKIQVSFLDVLRFAGSYWMRQPVKLAIIVVMLTGAAFIETYLPTALAEFLSAIKQNSDAAAVYHKLGIFLGAYLAQAIVFSIVYTLYNLFETRIFKNLIDDAFEHVYRLSEHFFVNTFTGSIVSKINRARQRIESFEDQIFHRVLTTAVVLIGSTIFLSLRFPLLGLLLMVYLVLLMGISVFLVFYIWR